MERKIPAIFIILAGLALGLLAYSAFFGREWGISVPIYTAIVLITVVGFAVWEGLELNIRRLWLMLPILFFAAMFYVRANEEILFMDVLAILVLSALLTNHFSQKYLDEVGWFDYLAGLVYAGFMAFAGTFIELGRLFGWLKRRQKREASGQWVSILRGIFLALPILAIFAVLLASADPIFQEKLLWITSFLDPNFDWEPLFQVVIFTGAISWFMVGAIVFSITPRQVKRDETSTDTEDIEKQSPKFFRLNMTEAGIVLGAVVLLFAFFVFIQFAYLFSQQADFIESMTYANYARRGFFELVAVSVMSLALMLGLDRSTLKRAQGQQLFFRLACILLVSLTMVILASAWRRMALYEAAYGFSHLRFYVHVFMVCIGILFAVALLDIFRGRAHIFSLGSLLVAIAFLATLNIVNVDAYIAQHNIDRYREGKDLDICYFYTMSVDAAPTILDFYQTMEQSETRDAVQEWLYYMRWRTEEPRDFLASNLSYDAARGLSMIESASSSSDSSASCFGSTDDFSSRQLR
jgi:hypothetical protein